jgi:hypothetical protein
LSYAAPCVLKPKPLISNEVTAQIQQLLRIDASTSNKNPSGDISNVFSLGRLVLVASDIPAETIISGRANFLQSSLRRFDEAYLFSLPFLTVLTILN